MIGALFIVSLLVSVSATQQSNVCPTAASLDAMLNLGSIYIGELHGTEQAPSVVKCLVGRAVERRIEPLVVSLELPETSRKGSDLFWHGQDGRSSEAMWQLVSYLLPLEAEGKIQLHFQEGNGSRHSDFDATTGAALHDMALHERVIAYGGNYHALRDAPDGVPASMEPAGVVVGKSMKHVLISSVSGGDAWICMGQKACGPQSIPGSKLSDASVGKLMDGSTLGYDRVFFVGHYTYSPPHLGAVIRRDVDHRGDH